MEAKVMLSFEDAEKMLPTKGDIHTFRNPNGMMIGCDWDRKDLLDSMKENADSLQLSGAQAMAMNHGLVLKDRQGYLFIETKKAK